MSAGVSTPSCVSGIHRPGTVRLLIPATALHAARMIDLPPDLLTLAEQQLGILGRFQLSRWLSPERVDGYVRRGHLVVVERGIYRATAGAVVAQQAPFAAALRARPGATITGPAVLGHLGVDGFDASAPFEILVQPDRRLRNVGFPWRPDPRPDREVRWCGEVRLAEPSDALVHSVRWRQQLGDRSLRLGCDWLGWRGFIDRADFLDRLVSRARIDPDATQLLEVLGGLELGRSESDGERVVGSILSGFDPAPEPQVWLTRSHRGDWVFVLYGVVVEYKGVVDHTGDANEARDAAREADVGEDGWAVISVTARDLEDEPALVARVVTVLTLRAMERGLPTPSYDPARRLALP